MNIMVTGGCGFMGSHLIKLLISKGYNIINVDKLTYAANVRNLESVEENYELIVMDIADDSIGDIISEKKIDIIINMAAQTHVDRSIKEPKEFLETDIVGVFNLIYNGFKNDVDLMIHISTDEVYGPILKGRFNESSIMNPVSPYAASKACADIMIKSYIRTYNLPAIIVRPCNNYGTNQYAEKLIPTTITRFLSGKKALVHGEGKEIREWISTEECCDVIYKIMLNGNIGEIYNIGTGLRLSNMAVISEIIDIMFKDRSYEDHIEFVMNRPGNDARYAINSNKTIKLVGDYIINPKFKYFKNRMKEIVTWYKNNPWFWGEVDLESNRHSENYLR